MSMDASLKAASALVRHRNVLTRDERLLKLKEAEKWREGHVLGLPKVGHRKAALAKSAAKEEAAEGAEGAAAPAAGAKAAAPAAGAKAAAPAAKGAAPAAKAAAPAAKGKK